MAFVSTFVPTASLYNTYLRARTRATRLLRPTGLALKRVLHYWVLRQRLVLSALACITNTMHTIRPECVRPTGVVNISKVLKSTRQLT